MKQPGTYQPRTYRQWVCDADLVSFNVTVQETDLFIRAQRDLHRRALRSVLKHRQTIEKYIESHPAFTAALIPLPVEEGAPSIVKEMAEASRKASVGPMAAVAGAIAEAVGKDLLPFSPEVIIENGGDIFMKVTTKRRVGIYAGDSPLSHRIALEILPEETPLGICTSSGTVGHSLSFGRADAVTVIARSAALADAAATAAGNRISDSGDIEKGLAFLQGIGGLEGAAIIKGERIGLWGKLRIIPV